MSTMTVEDVIKTDDIEIVPDVDSIASTEVMLGCGDSNPYR